MMLFVGWVFVLISAALNVVAMAKPGGNLTVIFGAGLAFGSGCVLISTGLAERTSQRDRL